jgi:hypothetical protein
MENEEQHENPPIPAKSTIPCEEENKRDHHEDSNGEKKVNPENGEDQNDQESDHNGEENDQITVVSQENTLQIGENADESLAFGCLIQEESPYESPEIIPSLDKGEGSRPSSSFPLGEESRLSLEDSLPPSPFNISHSYTEESQPFNFSNHSQANIISNSIQDLHPDASNTISESNSIQDEEEEIIFPMCFQDCWEAEEINLPSVPPNLTSDWDEDSQDQEHTTFSISSMVHSPLPWKLALSSRIMLLEEALPSSWQNITSSS